MEVKKKKKEISTNSTGYNVVKEGKYHDYRNDDTVRIVNSIFDGNSSGGERGGAVTSIRGNVQFTNTEFKNSQVASENEIGKGGHIYTLGGNLDIKGTDFHGNPFGIFGTAAFGTYGGMLFIDHDSERQARGDDRGADHNVFNGNQQNSTGADPVTNGGAVWVRESTNFINCNFFSSDVKFFCS